MKITHHRKRPLLIASVILLIAIINYLNPRMGYNELLDADAMNVFSNGSLIGTFAEPQDILDTYQGTIVGVGVIDISRLGLKKSDFEELYTIGFVKNNKVISTIEMLVPQLKDESTERKVAENCREFNGEYVVMHEDGCYFIFNRRICQVITPNPQSLYLQWFPALRSPAYSCLTLSKINRLREKQGKKR